jgi:hypothetical protein
MIAPLIGLADLARGKVDRHGRFLSTPPTSGIAAGCTAEPSVTMLHSMN